ncbi:hypothetical protein CONLIGDRAFT_307888 [Coniochaeta ligniaria NRRL 30616]|uniref:Uncharacterized protein n=1 Tax=Coniochaeta ligniaria NRRL 30616 TaxID=1408157 RepID=A0A1J7IUA1_9PEZI|nr:hypothetical protein CONLIGDRAFT_307888 [Coniochaeta ligniaria NRRL 30616]
MPSTVPSAPSIDNTVYLRCSSSSVGQCCLETTWVTTPIPAQRLIRYGFHMWGFRSPAHHGVTTANDALAGKPIQSSHHRLDSCIMQHPRGLKSGRRHGVTMKLDVADGCQATGETSWLQPTLFDIPAACRVYHAPKKGARSSRGSVARRCNVRQGRGKQS